MCLKFAVGGQWGGKPNVSYRRENGKERKFCSALRPKRLAAYLQVVNPAYSMQLMSRWLVALGGTALLTQASATMSRSIQTVFSPNAGVCVKFDQFGNPVGALVANEPHNRHLNRQMLALLRSRHWGENYSHTDGQWVALSVAPDGSPVPEVLPSCPN